MRTRYPSNGHHYNSCPRKGVGRALLTKVIKDAEARHLHSVYTVVRWVINIIIIIIIINIIIMTPGLTTSRGGRWPGGWGW